MVVTIGIFLLLGIPYIFSPFDADSGLFFTSGRMILEEGAVHYRDIVDIKPPLIYHIYAAAIGIFGPSTAGVRLFDYLIQIATALLLFFGMRRFLRNDATGAVAGFGYLLLYFGQSFRNTPQCESYVAILSIGAIWLVLTGRSHLRYAAAGAGLGTLILLKFSFAALVPILFLGEFIRTDRPPSYRHLLSAAAGVALMVGLFLLYVVGFGAWDDMLAMKAFTEGYAALQWASIPAGISAILEGVPNYFAVYYSVLFSLLTALGIAVTFRYRATDRENSPESTESDRLGETFLRYCGIAFLLTLLTLMVENKYQGWYFNRIFGFGAIFVGVGSAVAAGWIARMKFGRYVVVAGLPLLALAVAFSPLNRYVYHNAGAATYALKGDAAFDAFYGFNADPDERRLADLTTLGRYLKAHRGPDDEIYAASSMAGLLFQYAEYLPDFRVFHTCFLVAPYAPDVWREETRTYLLTEQPRFIVLQSDGMEPITGTDRTSRETVLALQGIPELLEREYSSVLDLYPFEVFRRKDTTDSNPGTATDPGSRER